MPVLAYIVAAVGVVIALLGVGVFASPGLTRGLVLSFTTPKMLYGALAFRIVGGVFFVFASEACSWPIAVGTIGVIMLVAGFAGLFIGMRRLQALMAWYLAFSDPVFRTWAVIAVLFGGFIVYAAV
jgi:hypothetical protein